MHHTYIHDRFTIFFVTSVDGLSTEAEHFLKHITTSIAAKRGKSYMLKHGHIFARFEHRSCVWGGNSVKWRSGLAVGFDDTLQSIIQQYL